VWWRRRQGAAASEKERPWQHSTRACLRQARVGRKNALRLNPTAHCSAGLDTLLLLISIPNFDPNPYLNPNPNPYPNSNPF
jgi:hypothetical protein